MSIDQEQGLRILDNALWRIACQGECAHENADAENRPCPCECAHCVAVAALSASKSWRFHGASWERAQDTNFPRETKMLAAWMNLVRSSGGSSDRLLAQILREEDRIPGVRDWYVATSVIQWLATNVGITVLEAAGFSYQQWDQDRADGALFRRRQEQDRAEAERDRRQEQDRAEAERDRRQEQDRVEAEGARSRQEQDCGDRAKLALGAWRTLLDRPLSEVWPGDTCTDASTPGHYVVVPLWDDFRLAIESQLPAAQVSLLEHFIAEVNRRRLGERGGVVALPSEETIRGIAPTTIRAQPEAVCPLQEESGADTLSGKPSSMSADPTTASMEAKNAELRQLRADNLQLTKLLEACKVERVRGAHSSSVETGSAHAGVAHADATGSDATPRTWDGWSLLIEQLNVLRKRLNEKPDKWRAGYSLHPGSILNAYREGDLSFEEASTLLGSEEFSEACATFRAQGPSRDVRNNETDGSTDPTIK